MDSTHLFPFTKYETWTLATQIAMALATLLVALLAVYGENLRRWLFRPRVGVLVDDGVPFVPVAVMVDSPGVGKCVPDADTLTVWFV